jgi:mRNA-degrading endonuclease RelE of RelBE toxin-antitoxin system
VNRLLVWEPQAFADWAAIEQRDPEMAERILLAIERYADTNQGDVRKLTARSDLYRLRVGTWRVLFSLGRRADRQPYMLIGHISDRRDAYR